MSERSVQEVEITRLKNAQDKLTRQLSIYDCNKLYQELKDIKAEKVEVEGKIEILLKIRSLIRIKLNKSDMHCMSIIP